MSDTPKTLQEECYGTCWATCERIEELESQLRAASNRIKRLEDALTSIGEYWNRHTNERAMEDACWHAVNTAAGALEAKEAKL